MAGGSFNDWIEEAGVVGLWEVVKHYPYFRREFRETLARSQRRDRTRWS